jgi:hypothetical protein
MASLKAENEILRARLSSIEKAGNDDTRMEGTKAYREKATANNKRDRDHSLSPPKWRLKRLKLVDSPRVDRTGSSLTPSALSTYSSHDAPSPASIDMDETSDAHTPFDMAEDEDPVDDRLAQAGGSSAFSTCGLCTSSVDCLCRQLGIRDTAVDSVSQRMSLADHSLVDRRTVISVSSVAPIDPGSSTSRCSGDPSKCTACAGNSFGRTFCSSLAKAANDPLTPSGHAHVIASSTPTSINPKLTQCCKNPLNCTRGGCSSLKDYQKIHAQESSIRTLTKDKKNASDMQEDSAMNVDTVSCDIAWKTIEAHPNAHLADPRLGPSQLANLNLLADVVAGRSRCTLAPGESLPEPEDFPKRKDPRSASETTSIASSETMTRGSARVQVGYEESVPAEIERTLVPREVLERNPNRPRITIVRAEGLRDAIALLNREFGCSS